MIDGRIKSHEFIELIDNIETLEDNIEEILQEHTDRLNSSDQNIKRLKNKITELYPILSRFREEFDDYYTFKRKVDRDTNLLATEYFSIIKQNKKKDCQIKKLNICIIFLVMINTISFIKNFLQIKL